MSNKRLMVNRLTAARKDKGLTVKRIFQMLNERRAATGQPPLHKNTVYRWFSDGVESVQERIRDDLTETCRLLDIPSVDDLWRHQGELVARSEVIVSPRVFQLLPLLNSLTDEQISQLEKQITTLASRDPLEGLSMPSLKLVNQTANMLRRATIDGVLPADITESFTNMVAQAGAINGDVMASVFKTVREELETKYPEKMIQDSDKLKRKNSK